MPYTLSHGEQIALGMRDADEPEIATHCPGPVDERRGCGRFLAAGEAFCSACQAINQGYFAWLAADEAAAGFDPDEVSF